MSGVEPKSREGSEESEILADPGQRSTSDVYEVAKTKCEFGTTGNGAGDALITVPVVPYVL